MTLREILDRLAEMGDQISRIEATVNNLEAMLEGGVEEVGSEEVEGQGEITESEPPEVSDEQITQAYDNG